MDGDGDIGAADNHSGTIGTGLSHMPLAVSILNAEAREKMNIFGAMRAAFPSTCAVLGMTTQPE